MPEPLPLLALNHIARLCKDLDASRRFYTELLGGREISRPPFSFAGSWIYLAGIQIHLIAEQHLPSRETAAVPRENHIAFSIADTDDVELRLQEHRVEYYKKLIPERNIQQIFFRDPDGWLIELGSYWAIDH